MEKKKALIIGISGQDGSYLAEFLLEKGYEVHGLLRRSSTPNTKNIEHILDKINIHYGDLSEYLSLHRLIDAVQPNEIYNLGAQSFVKASFTIPEYTFDITGNGVIRMLEAIKETNSKIKFYQASSSEMFGKVAEIPQTEKTPFYPRSPYGIAKLAGYWATVNYRESYGIHASNGILFNHESPRRGEEFVTRKITRAASRIHYKLQERLILGNLNAKRDWGHARDYVRAMYLMLQQDTPDDYVIATGETHTITEFLDACFEEIELDWKKYVVSCGDFFRPAEVDILLGDSSKARQKLGWEPETTFKDLVREMIDYDLIIAKKELDEKMD